MEDFLSAVGTAVLVLVIAGLSIVPWGIGLVTMLGAIFGGAQ